MNSGIPILIIRILAQFVSNDFSKYPPPLSHAKRFHFKTQTHIDLSSAKMNTPSAWDSLLLAKVSKITPPSNANSCDFEIEGTCFRQSLLDTI